MKLYRYLPAAVGLLLTGCMSPDGRPDYTASGALAGGAAGALLGSIESRSGAAAGGALGAVVGGLIGHGMDQTQEAELRAQSPQTLQRIEQGDPLTIADVQALVNAGVGDELILSQIRNSRTVYHLSTADIISLKNSGVSDLVIDYMINTPSQSQSATVVGEVGRVPPAPRPEVIVPSPGPGCVWVAGAWLWAGDHWRWRSGYWHRPGPSRRGPHF